MLVSGQKVNLEEIELEDKRQKHKIAYTDYISGDFTYQQLADKYEVSLSAIRAWRNRYWSKMDDTQNGQDNIQTESEYTDNIQGDIQPNFDLARPADRLKNQLNNMIVPVVLSDIKESDLPAYIDDNGQSLYYGLDHRHRRFVDEYMVDLNNKEAAIRAGYKSSSATEMGCRLFNNPIIKECIDRRLAEASRRTGVNEAVIDRELNRLVRVNIGDVVDIETGAIRMDISRDDLAAVQSIRVKITPTRDGEPIIEREVKMVAKEKLLELAMKRHGMLTQITSQVNIQNNINNMDADQAKVELTKMIAKYKKGNNE